MEYPGLRRLVPIILAIGVLSLAVEYLPAGTPLSDAVVTAIASLTAALGWGAITNGRGSSDG